MFTKELYEEALDFFKIKDPKIWQLMNEIGMIPIPPKRNIFSVLIGVIIGQRIRFTLARSLRGKLYTKLGTDDFTKEDILQLGQTGLIELGIEAKIAELIYSVAEYYDVRTMQDVYNLRDLNGIGTWTINTTCLTYSLNEDKMDIPDIVLYEDLIINRAIKNLYGVTKKSDQIAVAEKWIPYGGVVTLYLWKKYT
jgi:3-methyladenine DNA glycosylase/8-oxoguanine DNA glycosylase